MYLYIVLFFYLNKFFFVIMLHLKNVKNGLNVFELNTKSSLSVSLSLVLFYFICH